MNGEIRAVREAERQLRQLPGPLSVILLVEALAGTLQPDTDWAGASPFGTLDGGAVREKKETVEKGARRPGRAPEPPNAAPSAGAGDLLRGVVTGARKVAEGVGEVVAKGAEAEAARLLGEGLPGVAIREAVGGGMGKSASGSGAGAQPGASAPGDASPSVFPLGALARAASAFTGGKAAPRAGKAQAPAMTGSFADALAGRPAPSPEAAARELAKGVAVAALEAAGGVASAAEVFSPAIAGIGRRLEQVAARAAAAGESSPVKRAGGAARGKGGAPAAAAGAEGGAEAAPAPGQPRPGGSPAKVPGIAPVAGEVAPRETPRPTPPQIVDADWVVAVVGDALLEQARRQGVDLT